jgi:putative ABC transport system ATP-binding protein
MTAHVIECRDLVKTYRLGGSIIHALAGVSLTIGSGDYVAVTGASGSGKSTFMNLVGALDVPTAGMLSVDGLDIARLGADRMARFRNESIGFVFQQFNLLSRTTALANVMLPLLYSRTPIQERSDRARRSLERVGLGARLDHHPSQLSGGQQQRVAIARALVNAPRIILADEPTGALDTATSNEIMAIFDELNAAGITIIVVTHEADIAARARRRLVFRDGRLVGDDG